MEEPLVYSEGTPENVKIAFHRDEDRRNDNSDEERFDNWAKDHIAHNPERYDLVEDMGIEVWIMSPRPSASDSEIECEECERQISREEPFFRLSRENSVTKLCRDCFETTDRHYLALHFNVFDE